MRHGTKWAILGPNTIDASHRAAGTHVHFRQLFRRYPARMLDDKAMHVHHPQAAVRPSPDLYGTKPIVSGGEKLRSLFILGPASGEGAGARRELHAMNHKIDRLTHERIAAVVLTEQIIAIDAESARSRDAIGRAG